MLAIPIGFVVGISLGALGGGGSILTVPALVYLLGESPHGATTASLAIVGVTALAGSLAHGRAGRLRLGNGLVFGALGVAGCFVGSRHSAGIDIDVLMVAFAALMLLAAAAMARRSHQIASRSRRITAPAPVAALVAVSSRASGGPPEGGEPLAEPSLTAAASNSAEVGHTVRWGRVTVAATVVGLLTGFFGVGGGFVVVPALVLALGLSMPEAVGTSLVVIALNAATALVSRIGTHALIDWRVVGAFCAAAIAGSLVGARIAGRARPQVLGAAFALLLVALSLYTAARSLPHLL